MPEIARICQDLHIMLVDHLQKAKKKDKRLKKQDITYKDFNDLIRSTASDKILRDKTFKIAKDPKYVDVNADLLPWTCFKPHNVQTIFEVLILLICN